jgi:diguanylate cyclase (GGDEF)-like protein
VELDTLAKAEHLRVIFKNSLIVLLGNLSAGAVLATGLWSAVPKNRLLAWLAVLAILHCVLWVVSRRMACKPPDRTTVRHQENLVLSATLISGALWGSAAIIFYLPHHPVAILFLALVLVAVTAAASTLLSFHRFAYPAFLATSLIPLTARLTAENEIAPIAAGTLMLLYSSFLIMLSRQMYRFAHEAMSTALIRERHALVDHLTAIPNRRAFEESLEREWSRAMRSGRPLTLIVSDIDDFKGYNDDFGHAVGDAILRSVAGLFREAARRGTDLAARIGGDEFVLLAPETDGFGGAHIVRSIQRRRDQLAEDTYRGWQFPTLSFGLRTGIPSAGVSAFELFEEADAALYTAKAARTGPAARRQELREPPSQAGDDPPSSCPAPQIDQSQPRQQADSAGEPPAPPRMIGGK